MSDLAIAAIAFAIFAGIPLTICGWAFLLAVRDRKRADAADLTPMGDGTDTPTTLQQIRRANWRRENEDA